MKITPLENSRTRTILLVGQTSYVGVFCPFLDTESIGREFYAVHLADATGLIAVLSELGIDTLAVKDVAGIIIVAAGAGRILAGEERKTGRYADR